MTNKIVLLDEATLGKNSGIEKIADFGELTTYNITPPQERVKRIKGHNIVVTNKVVIDKEVMDACAEIKLICLTATGMNNVDLEYAKTKGITVKNVAGYSTQSVAQSTFAMLFHLIHRYGYYDQYVKSGQYAQSPIFTHQPFNYFELKSKTYGVIGLGTIGKEVARLATAFGCKVLYYSTSGKNKNAEYKQVDLPTLLKTSNVISIHCPLNQQTKNLLGKKELQLMKPNGFLLNLGRGGIVNEKDLAEVVNSGHLGGVALDVLEYEPILAANPLLSTKHPEKLLITPHIAWSSNESMAELIQGVYENIDNWVKG